MTTEAELAETAAASRPLRHAYRIGTWAGDGRDITEGGRPADQDLGELAAALGITGDGAAESTAPELLRAWIVALEAGFIEIDRDQAHSGVTTTRWPDYSAADTLFEWVSGLVASIETILDTVDVTEATDLAHAALDVFGGLDDSATAQDASDALEARLNDDYSDLADYLGAEFDLGAVVADYRTRLPAELRAFGAIDDNHRVTAIGEWARKELASWDNDESGDLEALGERLIEAGVDPDDPDAVREWLENNPDEFADLLVGASSGDSGEEFRTLDLKAAFDLPDELAPMTLPAPRELARLIRDDNPELAEASDETTVDSWRDELYSLLSQGRSFFEQPDPDPSSPAAEFELDFDAVGAIVGMRLFLGGAAEVDELSDLLRDATTPHLDEDSATAEWERWVGTHDDPAATLTNAMIEAGAAFRHDDTVELTEPARDAIRDRVEECGVRVPLLPPTEQLSATELTSALETVNESESLRLIESWLSERDPDDAAGELLGLAGSGTATQRMIATNVVDRIEPAPRARWEAALDNPALRPHARMALATLDSDADDDVEVDLDSDELAWLLADTLAATAERLDEEELGEYLAESLVPAGDDPELLDGIRRSGHPDAHEVLTTIGRHHPDAATAEAARDSAAELASTTSHH